MANRRIILENNKIFCYPIYRIPNGMVVRVRHNLDADRTVMKGILLHILWQ